MQGISFNHRIIFGVLILILLANPIQLISQAAIKPFQYGFGGRLTIDLLALPKDKTKFWLNWRLAFTAGAAYDFQCQTNNHYRPSAHVDIVFMQGGNGTKDLDQLRGGFKKLLNRKRSNFFFVGTLHPFQYGATYIENREGTRLFQQKPLYYFSDFTYPVLTNPFANSYALGTSFVYNYNANDWQRASSFYFSIQHVQFIYVNDGPPFALGGFLGDRKDRWFTGDGILSYYNNNGKVGGFDNFEIVYHKFTGYRTECYETSRDLMFTEVSYDENHKDEYKYNSGSLSIRGFNTKNNFGVGLIIHDIFTKDIQHLIHYNRYFPHHISPNPTKFGIVVYGQTTQNYNSRP